jgi:hypothetical protein
VITDPGTGTQLIVIRGGTVDDVAHELAKFTTTQILGKNWSGAKTPASSRLTRPSADDRGWTGRLAKRS